jgi:UDP-N-acetylglucosamine--N-acetylmuramyl-(pentapeptide) pyrophosphoryl-undecaprenol N-acetylglucosamine transferase
MSAAGTFVLIMAGGTGGHIFPGLAVADSLRQRGVEVRWLGARGAMECERVPASGIPLDVVDIAGLRGKGAASWMAAPWRVLRAVHQAWRLLGRRRPFCAISFGGYAAGPGGLAARLRGIPLLVHEQNRVAGMTNRVLARFAARVLQAFPGTWDEALQPATCGNPVRREVAELPPPGVRLARREGPARLLVTGGSQGALALNRLIPEVLALLPAGLAVEVRHQAGRGRQETTAEAYRAAGIEPVSSGLPQRKQGRDSAVRVSEFVEDMAEAYGWADLVICRAGALTVSEVAAAGLPAIFVPFPHAVDDHQTRNAEYLVERGAALLFAEADISARRLADAVMDLLRDPARRMDMAVRARAAAEPDAAARVADVCGAFAA